MDNTINDPKANTKEKVRNYKKNYLTSIIILAVLMGFQLFAPNLYDMGEYFPIFWIIFVASGITFHRENWKEIIPWILPVLNYLLFKLFHIYIPNYIILFIIMAILTIFYAIKENSNKRNIKIAVVFILCIMSFSVNYYLYSNRIIKDGNLEAEIKRYREMARPAFLSLKQEELNNIERIGIGGVNRVRDLRGIEEMHGLKELSIYDDGFIMDYNPLLKCKNLKILNIYDGYLNKLGEIETFENIDDLYISNIRKGSLDIMPYFLDVKTLSIHTNKPISLMGLKNFPKVEKLSLDIRDNKNFDEIASLTNLKELTLYDRVIKNYDKLLEIPTLKKLNIYSPINVNEELVKAARAKGIEVNIMEEPYVVYE